MSKAGVFSTMDATRLARAARFRSDAAVLVVINHTADWEDAPATQEGSSEPAQQRPGSSDPDAFPLALEPRRVRVVSDDFLQLRFGQVRLLVLQIKLGQLDTGSGIGMIFQHPFHGRDGGVHFT